MQFALSHCGMGVNECGNIAFEFFQESLLIIAARLKISPALIGLCYMIAHKQQPPYKVMESLKWDLNLP